MTLTQKVTRAAPAAATAEEFIQSDHKSVANREEVKEDDETLESKKPKRDIVEWIGQPRKPPSSNNAEKAKGKEEDVGSTQVST